MLWFKFTLGIRSGVLLYFMFIIIYYHKPGQRKIPNFITTKHEKLCHHLSFSSDCNYSPPNQCNSKTNISIKLMYKIIIQDFTSLHHDISYCREIISNGDTYKGSKNIGKNEWRTEFLYGKGPNALLSNTVISREYRLSRPYRLLEFRWKLNHSCEKEFDLNKN